MTRSPASITTLVNWDAKAFDIPLHVLVFLFVLKRRNRALINCGEEASTRKPSSKITLVHCLNPD